MNEVSGRPPAATQHSAPSTQHCKKCAAPVEPGKPLVLKPGGYHVMLMGLRRSLKEGDEFPVTIRFAQAGAVSVTAHVAKAGAAAPPGAPDMGRDHGAMSH